jgi:tetratricopeptide (TPR) repeat protein
MLGKIYLKLEQKTQAKQYFQQALELAKALDYKVDYFQQLIAK